MHPACRRRPDPELLLLLERINPRRVFYLSSSADDCNPAWLQSQRVSNEVSGPASSVGVYVPVNPLAALHRHHGFGFTGYQLVLVGPRLILQHLHSQPRG